VRCEGSALRILTDAEAVYYKTKRFDSGYRVQRKAYQRGLEIDEANLDEATRDTYRKMNHQQSRLLTAAQDEYKRIRSEERKNERPVKPLDQEIKIFTIRKDTKENGNATIESDDSGSGPDDLEKRMDSEPVK
jgi:hypothetical protein